MTARCGVWVAQAPHLSGGIFWRQAKKKKKKSKSLQACVWGLLLTVYQILDVCSKHFPLSPRPPNSSCLHLSVFTNTGIHVNLLTFHPRSFNISGSLYTFSSLISEKSHLQTTNTAHLLMSVSQISYS